LPIQNIFLKQAEERFHRGVIRAGPDPAHRSAHAVGSQRAQECVRSKLAAAIGEHHGRGGPVPPQRAVALLRASMASREVIRAFIE
jgi:hypothetical protein